MASFIAAGTSYAHRGVPMVPFYTFYSMFGFQRVGDLIWQAADARARGFLLGATAGRTTLLGEGLQHQDGHSLVLASTVPPVQAYDPAFAYEVAAIVQAGLQRMYGPDTPPEDRDVFYYLTLYNENYVMPADARGRPARRSRPASSRACTGGRPRPRVRRHRATRAVLRQRPGRGPPGGRPSSPSTSTSASSCGRRRATSALREDALAVARWNRLHPDQPARTPRVAELLGRVGRPDRRRHRLHDVVPEQIARFLPGRSFTPLGTDGMGRSDTREALRRFFEVDTGHVVVAVLAALAAQGDVKPEVVNDAIARYDIDPEAVNPYLV